MEIKNLKKAAGRILKAIKDKERIILYGDADLDGVASIIILKESIQNLGGEVSAVYFPDRETEGYGISETGLNYLKKFAPALFIALDCGIGNFKGVKLAKKLEFEVIIIDHHQVLGKLPDASIIVDPKQKGDKSPFKELAAAGIVFKLSELLLRERGVSQAKRQDETKSHRLRERGVSQAKRQDETKSHRLKDKMTGSLRRNFLELAALATIADMMPREQENKTLIERGLASMESSWRPGLQTFFEIEPFSGIANLNQKVSKLVSILNTRDLEKGVPAGFRLLISSSKAESQKIIEKLLKKSELRKEKINKMAEEIERQLSKESEDIVFVGSAELEFGLISSLASIICNKYRKPTFIFKKGIKESQGAVRALSDVNTVCLMEKCSKYLLAFGGHPRASGFRIKNENLEKFRKCLIRVTSPSFGG